MLTKSMRCCSRAIFKMTSEYNYKECEVHHKYADLVNYRWILNVVFMLAYCV